MKLERDNKTKERVQQILEKYDLESKTRAFKGIKKYLVKYLLAGFSIYAILLNFVFHFETRINRASFVGLLVFFAYLLYPLHKGAERDYIPWYDILLSIVSAFCYFYFVFNCDAIIDKGIYLTPLDVTIGVIGILTTLFACVRVTGLPIVLVASAFLIYGQTQKSLTINIFNLFYNTDGVLGTPTKACQTFIVLFVIFGAFIEKSGISDFFIQLANSIAGATVGGPAKVSVISSALCGMVSGSSVGNTVTTGSITIPLMKKNGYNPEFAGAVEAAASTGGQIMPPIMGAAAFLMIEYTKKEYSFIALHAILPAFLYFAGIFIAVHLEAKKFNLKGLDKNEIPSFFKVFKKAWYLMIPLLTLILLITKFQSTMAFAALVSIITSIVVSMFDKNTRMNYHKIIEALEIGAKNTISVGIACAIAGIIACIITTTGIGSILISSIVGLANGQLIIAMILTMLTCIVLGMGVPTTANYVIMATTCAPILIRMNMNPFAAHLFVFYFGIVADITPPVALAAYAGSAISGASPMKTAFNATQLAIGAFIVPYIFGLNNSLLLIDASPVEVILIIITSLLGIFGVASALRGYALRETNPLERILMAIGGLMLIYPGILTDVVGLLLLSVNIATSYYRNKNVLS